MVPYLNKAQGLTYWYNMLLELCFSDKFRKWTEIRQFLRRRCCKFSVGSPFLIEGVRALSHTYFQKVCVFYGALDLGVYGCICARCAPQDSGASIGCLNPPHPPPNTLSLNGVTLWFVDQKMVVHTMHTAPIIGLTIPEPPAKSQRGCENRIVRTPRAPGAPRASTEVPFSSNMHPF